MSLNIYTDIIQKLIDARKRAGLTQEQVAERMHTKQAAIARLEKKKDGSLSLRRIADYALACGMIPCSFEANSPLEFHLVPIEDAREFTIEDPKRPLTWQNWVQWKLERIRRESEPPPQWSQPMNWLSCNGGKLQLAV